MTQGKGFSIKCISCGNISFIHGMGKWARCYCHKCGRRYSFKSCIGCEHHSYDQLCLIQKDKPIELLKCPIGKWHRLNGHVYRFSYENVSEVVCPRCSKIIRFDKTSNKIVYCSKCYLYLGKGGVPPQRRIRTKCEDILKKHHDDLKDDPNRLSTKFIADVAGCSCRVTKKKLEKNHA